MNSSSIKSLIKKYPLGTVAVVVLLVMAGLLYVRNMSAEENKAALEKNTQDLERYQSNISYAAQLDEHLKALESANQVVTERLVNPQDLASNLEYFYKLEREAGVKVLDSRPAASVASKAPASKVGYKPVTYAVSVQGSYMHVLAFLRRLEQGSYFCRVVTANCNPAQEDRGDASSDKKQAAEVILTLTIEILGKA